MLKLVIITLSVLVFNSSAFAKEPIRYGGVQSAVDRQSSYYGIPFPGWETMEIVREGVVDNHLASLIPAEQWDGSIKWNQLEALQLRNFDIFINEVEVSDQEIRVPFGIGVRFAEKGLSGVVKQGTINSNGVIVYTVPNGSIDEIKVDVFYDSQELEAMGRKMRLIDQYNGDFAESIIVPLLGDFLSDENYQRELIQLTFD